MLEPALTPFVKTDRVHTRLFRPATVTFSFFYFHPTRADFPHQFVRRYNAYILYVFGVKLLVQQFGMMKIKDESARFAIKTRVGTRGEKLLKTATNLKRDFNGFQPPSHIPLYAEYI